MAAVWIRAIVRPASNGSHNCRNFVNWLSWRMIITQTMRAEGMPRAAAIRLANRSAHFCPRCQHGLRDEWRFCPWCWGASFRDASGPLVPDARYRSECVRCGQPMMDGMRYCPWCHARRTRPVSVEEIPDACPHCKSSVVKALWAFCPWCAGQLEQRRA